MTYKTTILIPARMESTRFPGKPLALINNIPMVVYCAKNAIATGLDVYVCTDSKEIQTVCSTYNVRSILTGVASTGTDRIAQAIKDIHTDYVINLQGDEPLIDTKSLKLMIGTISILEKTEDKIITGISSADFHEACDPNNVKCAFVEKQSKVLYFSRQPLINNQEENNSPLYYKQIGLYAMSKKNLFKFSSLREGILEKAEKVELLRWMENGYGVFGCKLNCQSISVDTPNDLINVNAKLKNV
ncbi:3-deoxy-manno-octulosonate cytidylyltransferase [Prochlorococcus sp. AH-736-A21]|nr:3-deoxy-manno-octulosonate cytidylyltransferase [Prochlorococcus sp. AH-736-A21]